MHQLAYKWILIVLAAGIFVFCDALSAGWAKGGNKLLLLIMVPLAPFAYFLFGLINKRMTLGASGGLVNAIIVVGAVFVSKFFFGESLTGLQYTGLAFALIAIVLLSY